jgi:chromosome segregation ATPase
MELKQDNLIDDLTKPQVFLSQINTLKEKLPSILDDFKKYYVFYNKNPEYNEYQQMFENIKGNLQNINSELFMVSNNIEKNTETINDRLQKINALIAREKIKNRQLKRRLGIVEKKYNGSDELISDYKEIYNLDYLNNFALFYGIILLGVVMALKFNVKPSVPKV